MGDPLSLHRSFGGQGVRPQDHESKFNHCMEFFMKVLAIFVLLRTFGATSLLAQQAQSSKTQDKDADKKQSAGRERIRRKI